MRPACMHGALRTWQAACAAGAAGLGSHVIIIIVIVQQRRQRVRPRHAACTRDQPPWG